MIETASEKVTKICTHYDMFFIWVIIVKFIWTEKSFEQGCIFQLTRKNVTKKTELYFLKHVSSLKFQWLPNSTNV